MNNKIAPGTYDVAMVGAGMASLTAAALLARAGHRVVVCEQYSKPGGFCHHWDTTVQHQGKTLHFRFDAGVHDFSGIQQGGCVHDVTRHLGLQSQLQWMGLAHAQHRHGLLRPVPRGWTPWVQSLLQQYPADGPGIRAACQVLQQVYNAIMTTPDGSVLRPPQTWLGRMRIAARHWRVARYLTMPIMDMLKAHQLSPEASRALLSLHGYVTHLPEALRVMDYVPLLGYIMHGGGYPLGGSGVVSQLFADSIALDGGELRYGVTVQAPVIERGRVRGLRLTNGESLMAKHVVYGGDTIALGRQLLAQGCGSGWAKRLAAQTPANSMLMLHLGLVGDRLDLPPVIHLEHRGAGYELVSPSMIDPSAASPGYHTLEVMQLLTPAQAAPWFADAEQVNPVEQRHGAEYLQTKREHTERLLGVVSAVIPDIAERVVCAELGTPITFRRYGMSALGTVYGLPPPFGQHGARTPINGLYLAGSANLGPGVEAVVLSAIAAAEAVHGAPLL